VGLINSTVILGDSIRKSHGYLWIQFKVLGHLSAIVAVFDGISTSGTKIYTADIS